MAELVSIKRNVDVSPGQAAPAVFHCSQGDVGSKIILGLLNNAKAFKPRASIKDLLSTAWLVGQWGSVNE